MRTRIAAVGAVFVVAVASGCSGTDEDTGSGASGACGDVGVLLPLSGGSAASGEIVRNALELVVSDPEFTGDLSEEVKLEFSDTELVPEKAVSEAQRLISRNQVSALLGPWSTSEALAVGQLAEDAEVVNINIAATAPEITEGKEFVFRTSPVTTDTGHSLVDLAGELGGENVVMVHDNGAFGRTAIQVMEDYVDGAGPDLELVGVEVPANATDVTGPISTVSREDPDVVIIGASNPGDVGLIMKALSEQNVIVPVIGFSTVAAPDAIQIAPDAYAAMPSVHVLGMATLSNPKYQKLLDAYNEEYDTDLTSFTDQVPAAVDALITVSEARSASDCATGRDLRDAISELEPFESYGGKEGSMLDFTSGQDGHVGDYLTTYKIEDGKLLPDESIGSE